MKVTVIGSGYVGLITEGCLSGMSNDVLCFDVDRNMIDVLNSGSVAIHGPRPAELIRRNLRAGRLQFSTDADAGVAQSMLCSVAL
ncbi:hypothetical protein ACFONN_12410 [Dyella humi]|uniref:UDP-glucose 6-dehydrogenase n=1 Tax=Dyella humi TaxID=1770547 RepID=A0ABW8IKR8_9GAMM